MTAPRARDDLILGPIKPLTKQQQRVCDGIYRGLTYAQIAQELGALENRPPLSVHTVTFYVQSINVLFTGLERLDPRSRIYIAMVERHQRGL